LQIECRILLSKAKYLRMNLKYFTFQKAIFYPSIFLISTFPKEFINPQKSKSLLPFHYLKIIYLLFKCCQWWHLFVLLSVIKHCVSSLKLRRLFLSLSKLQSYSLEYSSLHCSGESWSFCNWWNWIWQTLPFTKFVPTFKD